MNHTKNSKEMTQNEMPILFSEEAGTQGLASQETEQGNDADKATANDKLSEPEDTEEEETVKRPLYPLPRDSDLPPVIRELIQIAPEAFKQPTFFAAATCLACLATRVRVYYIFDGMNEHALLLQTVIMGEQSSGKSFARNNVERIIMTRMKERDDQQRRQEQAYREMKMTAPKNEKLPEPPHTVIRTCPVSISIAQLIKRADAPMRYYGTPMTLWTFTDELSTAVESNKRAFSNIKSIARTSYDLHSEYGVDYLSDNSYSATVDILQCSLYLSTPNALDKYADKDFVEGGGVTRTILVPLNDNLGEEAPVFKILTDKQREVINRILDLMDKDVYGEGNDQVMPEMFIDMSWLDKTVTDWCRDQNKLVLRSGSRAHNTFYKRSSVSAFRIATLCAYLYGLECGTKELPNGLKRRVKRIYLFAAQYILDQMLGKWGKKYNDLMQNRVAGDSNVRLPVFDQLSGTFTTDQLKELLTRNELTTSAKVFLSKWKAKGWIMKVSKDVYKKNEKDDSTM